MPEEPFRIQPNRPAAAIFYTGHDKSINIVDAWHRWKTVQIWDRGAGGT